MPSSVNTVMSDCIHALVVLLLYGLHDNAFKNHRYTLSKEKIVLDFFLCRFFSLIRLVNIYNKVGHRLAYFVDVDP